MKKIVIYGAEDNGKKLAYEYRERKRLHNFELVGFIDDFKRGYELDFPILGGKEILPKLKAEEVDNIVVFLFKNPRKRLDTCLELESMGFNFPSFIGKDFPDVSSIGKGVYIHDNATFLGVDYKIGDFSVIGPYATIEGRTTIGKGCIICPYVFIGHNSEIGDASVIYPYAYISPKVQLDKRSIISPREKVTISSQP